MAHNVVVIGGGFSGCLLSAHLLRRTRAPLSVALIERKAVGCGAAYGTRDMAHLLNVPAAKMSAFPDDPGHFLRWLGVEDGGAFIARSRYRDYIQSILREATSQAPSHASLRIVPDEAVDFVPDGRGWRVALRSGKALPADRLVLAVGNLRPRAAHPDLTGLGACFVADPWSADWLPLVKADSSVLLIGAGLTMADIAISLINHGHRGPILAVSRRGLLPQSHAAAIPPGPFPGENPLTILGILRWIRGQDDWRGAMDSLRPRTQELWQSLSGKERGRFLRHAQPFWDTHRHRLPPSIHAAIKNLLKTGQLSNLAGRLESAVVVGGRARIQLKLRGSGAVKTFDVDQVVSCTGPEVNPTKTTEPLIQSLLARGLARPAEFALGFDVDDHGAVVRSDGTADGTIFTLGAWRKGSLWESVAVPELRVQAQALAGRLLEQMEVLA